MACLSEDQIVALVGQKLTPKAREDAITHLDGCADCRALVAELARDEGPAPLVRGAAVGRYWVLQLEGAGAMGMVYSAYDPELERKVALKFVRPERADLEPGLKDRLAAEARALARVSHPNVTAVYDIGTRGAEVFIAMEWVFGPTLAAWLVTPRPWRAILARFREAGEGLAAAHRAGIIHRDFKPDNILVGQSGRAQVTDFGLARAAAPLGDLTRGPVEVTRGLAGTPAYMAPEQLAGQPATERSDIFSFCVAFWEALDGRRPFSGDTPAELSGNIVQGQFARAQKIPRRLLPILKRGLAADPAQRWASMDILLAALGRAERPLWPWFMAGAAVLGLAAVLLKPTDPCQPTSVLPKVWPEARAARLRPLFLAQDPVLGLQTFLALQDAVKKYTEGLDFQAQAGCEARVRGEQSEALLDLQRACLDIRQAQLSGLLSGFERHPTLARVMSLMQRLPEPSDCARRDVLALRGAPPPGTAAQVSALEAEAAQYLANAWLDENLSLGPWEVLHKKSEAVGYAPLLARVQLARVPLARTPTIAAAWLSEVAATAFEARDDETLADAWSALVDIAGRDGRLAMAELAARQAQAVISRLQDPSREVQRLSRLCRAYERAGRLEEAHQQCAVARAQLLAYRSDDPRLGILEDQLGTITYWEAKYEEALGHYQRAEALNRKFLGDAHPAVENAQGNQAEVLIVLGRMDEGLEIYRKLSAKHPTFMHYLDGIGHALRKKGDPGAALVYDQKTLALCTGGAWSGCQIWARVAVAEDLLALGRWAEAQTILTAALAAKIDVPAADRARMEAAAARAWAPNNPLKAQEHLNQAILELRPWAQKYGRAYADKLRDMEQLQAQLRPRR